MYTYLIGWTKHNKWYYGVRFSNKSNPKDLWVTYFTSSKYVKDFRKLNGEPDIIEVRKVFNNANSARLWEEKVIRRLNLVSDNKWLNKSDNTKKFYFEGKRPPFSEEHKRKLSEAAKKRKRTKEHLEALHKGRRNSKNSIKHNEAISANRRNHIKSEETKIKMSDSRKNNPKIIELSSNAGKISGENRKESGYYKTQEYSDMVKKGWITRRKNKEVLSYGD